jgi:hypothetical protein
VNDLLLFTVGLRCSHSGFARLASARAFILLLALGASCQKPRHFPVVVSAISDDGEPIKGVAVTIGKSFIGITDEEGRVRTRLDGQEGSRVPVEVDVPSGYKKIPSNQTLILRRITRSEGNTHKLVPIEFSVRFAPLKRKYLVLVRTDIAGMPVEAFGVERAVTNSKGAAMFVYEGSPGSELKVRLATTERPDLKPQNPVMSFTLGKKSDAYVVQQQFAVPPPPKKKVKKPIRMIPRRL